MTSSWHMITGNTLKYNGRNKGWCLCNGDIFWFTVFLWICVLNETKAWSNDESHQGLGKDNCNTIASLSNSLTNTQSMQSTITGEQGDEWASVLNLLGLAELHKTRQISSRRSACLCVCMCRVKRLILVLENQTALNLTWGWHQASYIYGASVSPAKWTPFVG